MGYLSRPQGFFQTTAPRTNIQFYDYVLNVRDGVHTTSRSVTATLDEALLTHCLQQMPQAHQHAGGCAEWNEAATYGISCKIAHMIYNVMLSFLASKYLNHDNKTMSWQVFLVNFSSYWHILLNLR
jgi:hypothetical protein